MAASLPPGLSRRNIVTPQIVATRGNLPTTTAVLASSLGESRVTVRNGIRPCSDVQVGFPGFYVDPTGGETALPNDIAVMCAVEKVSPSKAVIASLNAQKIITVKAGSGITLTDPIGLDFAASEDFKVQFGCDWTDVANTYPLGTNDSGLRDSYRSTLTLATSQIGTAGTWAATSRVSSISVPSHGILIGRPTQNYPSVVIIGDSIMQNAGDSTGDVYGNHGFVQQGLFTGAAGGAAMPYAVLAKASEKASVVAAGGATMRMAMLRYCSHVICNYGTNDIVASATLVQMQGYLTTIWASMKRRGVQVWQVLILPRTTSSDSFATAANQTVVTGHGVGGVRDTINAWIRTQVGVLIDGIIDANVYLEDPANPSKWVTTGAANYATTDGTHPNSTGHSLAAPAVTAAALTFKLPAAVRF